jgi:hypothetical protein
MDVVHPLRLDPGKSGKEVPGYVGYFDIDLDRNTSFLPVMPGMEVDEVPTLAQVEKDETKALAAAQRSGQIESEISENHPCTVQAADSQETIKLEGNDDDNSKRDSADYMLDQISNIDEDEARQTMETLEPYSNQLQSIVQKYPLVSDNQKTLPYLPAPSTRDFQSWPAIRQKLLEWDRARAVQSDLLANLPSQLSDLASRFINIKSVVIWCRENDHGLPIGSDDSLQYCRFCGMLEDMTLLKGQNRTKVSWNGEAYCRCGKDIKEQMALMKTSSSVDDMLHRNQSQVQARPSTTIPSLTTVQLRFLLSLSDINMMRWTSTTMTQLNLPASQCLGNEEISQLKDEDSLTSTAVMTHATKSFLARLLHQTRQQTTTQGNEEDEVMIVGTSSKSETFSRPLVVTPIHILRAIRSGREFDFLTNVGMATGSS